MGRLLIVLLSSPIRFQSTDIAYKFAKSALDEKHEVVIFCFDDGVYNLMASKILPKEKTLTMKLVELLRKGAKIMGCRVSMSLRGIDPEKGLIEGVKASSIAELSQLMVEADRVIAFGLR